MINCRSQHRAHDTELQQVLCTAIDVCPQIEHVTVPFLCRQDRTDCRTVDARKCFKDKAGDGHQSAGISSGHGGLCFARFNQIGDDPHRRILLRAHRIGRRFVHTHHLARMSNAQTRPKRGQCFAKQRQDGLFAPNQDHVYGGMTAQKGQRSRHGHDRAVIATHAVDCNGDTHRLLA
ncbi:hypothetical protein SDC9_158899 [bioreactor metagenome]|uniref:Uncharacterized protein n=1 Tax=bioreactor metagenome TaxID=1076179 RepID=A0A645FDE1_9ZZZZ